MIDDALALEPDRAAWRRRASTASMLLMETFALFILGNLAAAPSRQAGPSLLTLLIAAALAYALVRTLRHVEFPRGVLVGAGVTVSCVCLWILGSLQYSDGLFVDSGLLLMLRDPGRALQEHAAAVFGLIIIAAAWVRGAMIGSLPRLTQRIVLGSLTAGLGIAFLGLALGAGGPAAQATNAAALALFVCGLLVLALLQLGLSEHIRGDSWRGPWLLVLLGTCALLALAGMAVGLLPLDLLNPLLAVLGGLLLFALDIALYVLVYPFAVVATWLLVHILGPHIHATDFKIQVPPPPNPRQLQHPNNHSAAAALALLLGHILLFAAILGAVLLVLLWLFRRVERERAADATAREPLELENALGDDVGALLAALQRRLRPRRPPSEPELGPRIRELRRLYLRLLRSGEARGVVRPPAATPREFAPELQNVIETELPLQLTDQFARGRYGRIEPSEEDLVRLREGFQRIR